MNVEISNVCNFQCSFCPAVIRPKRLIGLEEFRNTIRQIAPLTEQVAFHLMGDPLVHPHLGELIEICHEESVPIFLVTNGVLLREKQAQLLLHPAIRQVNFSLHSYPDNHPDRDPGPYLERIFAFTEEAFEKRPSLYINYRLWNLGDPRGENAKNRAMLQRIEERFGVRISPHRDVTVQKSEKLLNRLYLHWDTEFVWPSLELPVLGTSGRCHGLNSHFGVLVDGTVVPCCLDKEGVIPLGNLHETPVEEILNSPRALEMVRGFQSRKLVEPLCQRCNYIERFSK